MVGEASTLTEVSSELSDPFRIVSIISSVAPNGAAGAGWFRYEIVQGTNRIVGLRDGGIDNVTNAVELMVARLNERRYHRRGRVHVVLDSGGGHRMAEQKR